MKSIARHTIDNNHGSTMIMALLLIAALSLSAFMAAKVSLSNNKMMRNNRNYRDLLYNAETGITAASEGHLTGWLQSASVLFNLTNGNADVSNQNVSINDEHGTAMNVAQFSVARVEDYANDAGVDAYLDTDALTRSFYSLPHIAPPPIGSGVSAKNFEMRRYGILSRAINRRDVVTTMTIESGLSKVFNK
jgi:hypothetical protein